MRDFLSFMEKWDLYDKDRNIVSTNHVRGTWPIPDGMFHLVVHVWILTKDGKILLTQRSRDKETNPLKWEFDCFYNEERL